MIIMSKVIFHVMLACKWEYDFMTRPNMEHEVMIYHHGSAEGGRNARVRSTKHFVIDF